MKAASSVAHGGGYRLRRQFQLAEIKVSKAEPNERKGPDVSAGHKCDRTAGFFFIKRQPPFELNLCVFEPAYVQVGGADLVVTNHRAERVNAATQEWLGQLQEFRCLRPNQVIIAYATE